MADDDDSRPPSELGADVDLRNWASPDELLEMRARLHDITSRHTHEVGDLTRKVAALTSERDALAKELRHAEKLRDLHNASRIEAERLRQERERWAEEREMLILRLQQATNEALRLRGGGGAAPGSDGSYSQSVPSSTGSAAMRAAAAEFSSDAIVQAYEEAHRVGMANAELVARLDFQSSVHRIAQSWSTQRAANAAAQADAALARAKDAEDDLATLRVERDALDRAVAQLRGDVHRLTLELSNVKKDATAAATAAHEAADATTTSHQATLDAHKQALDAKLSAALDRHAAMSTQQASALDAALRAKADAASEAQARCDTLSEQLRSREKTYAADLQRAHDDARRTQQELMTANSEKERQRVAYCELAAERLTLVERAEDLNACLTAQRLEAERAVSELGRVRIRLDEACAEIGALRQVRTERDALAQKLNGAADELTVVQQAYETLSRQSALATELLQRGYDERCEKLMARIVDADAAAARATVRYKKCKAERDVLRHKVGIHTIATGYAPSDDASDVASQQSSHDDVGSLHGGPADDDHEDVGPAAAAAAPRGQQHRRAAAPQRIDVLELLRGNAAMVATLSRGVNGGREAL